MLERFTNGTAALSHTRTWFESAEYEDLVCFPAKANLPAGQAL
jgi:hypothetical protein